MNATLRFATRNGGPALLVVNSGPTVAERLKVAGDRARWTCPGRSSNARGRYESLPPGRSLMWPLGEAFKLMNEGSTGIQVHGVTASGPFGPVPALSYIVDMADWRGRSTRLGGKPSQADVGSEGTH